MLDRSELSLRERAAQLVFPRLGSNMPPPITVSEDLNRFRHEVLNECPVGGIVLFNGSLTGTPEALSGLQRSSGIPLLVATDMERGVGQQIRGATIFPHAMAFSEAGPALVERAARAQAREALACGIHITFAPDADVNRDPKNPIIATRAFSDDPHRAAELVQAYIAGCRAAGLLTTAKHFPGHGNTHQDSHDEVPVVHSGRDELLANDLVPFVAAISAGVDLVMTAHVLYPALDADRVATLSPRILKDFLRGELGFDGAVVTDSLLMGAIRADPDAVGRQAAMLVDAGVDIILDTPEPIAATDGIVEAVRSGMLSESRVNEAVDRVLTLKRKIARRFGNDIFVDASRAAPAAVIGAPDHQRLSLEVARAGIRVTSTSPGALPMPRSHAEGILGVLIKPHRHRFDPDEEPFADEFRKIFSGAVYRQVGPDAAEEAYKELQELARRAEYIVIALVMKPAAWHAHGLRPEQSAFIRRAVDDYNVILVSLGSPYILDDYPNASARLCTFSDVEVSQRAAVERLVEAAA